MEVIVDIGDGVTECKPIPLVRCRDCRWFKDMGEWQACLENAAFARKTRPDGYCDRGMRRE